MPWWQSLLSLLELMSNRSCSSLGRVGCLGLVWIWLAWFSYFFLFPSLQTRRAWIPAWEGTKLTANAEFYQNWLFIWSRIVSLVSVFAARLYFYTVDSKMVCFNGDMNKGNKVFWKHLMGSQNYTHLLYFVWFNVKFTFWAHSCSCPNAPPSNISIYDSLTVRWSVWANPSLTTQSRFLCMLSTMQSPNKIL